MARGLDCLTFSIVCLELTRLVSWNRFLSVKKRSKVRRLLWRDSFKVGGGCDFIVKSYFHLSVQDFAQCEEIRFDWEDDNLISNFRIFDYALS